jgi:hypothetical protein
MVRLAIVSIPTTASTIGTIAIITQLLALISISNTHGMD